MLLSKQWSRVLGGILATLLFLALLKSLYVPATYRDLFRAAIRVDYLTGKPGQSSATEDTPRLGLATTSEPSVFPAQSHGAQVHQTASTTAPTLEVPSSTPSGTSSSSKTSAAEATSSSTGNAASSTTDLRKTIVMGKLAVEDTDWVATMLQDWDAAIYVVDLPEGTPSPTGLRTKINKSKEAMPYLTYLVEHYDDFPDVAVFIHAHRKDWPAAWHNDAKDYDAVNMLHELRLDTVLDRGFVNLRCIGDPGCPAEIRLNRNPPDQSKHAELAYPTVYGRFFNMTTAEVRKKVPVIATPCCAQFAVSKAQVHKRPKEEYARFLGLLEELDYDDDTLGTVLEYMWHIMFGRDAVHCEATDKCWADIYGRQSIWTRRRYS